MPALGFHEPELRPSGSLAFLSPEFLDALLLLALPPQHLLFHLPDQPHSRHVAVERLRARGLAFDLQARRHMLEVDAGAGLVGMLPAGAAGPDKSLDQILFGNAEPAHGCEERLRLCGPNRKHCP